MRGSMRGEARKKEKDRSELNIRLRDVPANPPPSPFRKEEDRGISCFVACCLGLGLRYKELDLTAVSRILSITEVLIFPISSTGLYFNCMSSQFCFLTVFSVLFIL